jgi:FKBP-type peptidyl-prolyl cis-trans isomerase FklB
MRTITGNALRLLDAASFSTSVPHFFLACGHLNSMKTFLIGITLAALTTPLLAEDRPALKDAKDKVSYSIGLDIGTTFKKQKMELNSDALAAGVKDGLTGATPLMRDDEVRQVMMTFSKEMNEKAATANKESADKNTTEGAKFLADNKSKPGVKTTESGLQYKVLKEGNGSPPKATDTVVVNYRGMLVDGTEFDSSYKRGEPATFPVNAVIKGWTEALQLMKPGSKYQLFIPPNLGYGARGAGGDIGPNAALIFEVELLNVKPGESSGSPSPSASGSP